jgi:NADPH:quinone reductase-like Zn-dependent oxidoreductase
MPKPKKLTILGQDLDVIVAVFANILSWFVHRFFPAFLPYLLPKINEEDTSESPSPNQTKCIAVGRPGGKEQLRCITLKPGYVTCGYNVVDDDPSPFINVANDLPPNTVILRVHSFSINYADCCIRWGLYESANTFVGWPIVPGFDVAGVVEQVSKEYDDGNLQVGDQVYGATFFGAYSTRVLVPTKQLRKVPKGLTLSQAAAIPAVSLTALYTLYLGGQYPVQDCHTSNRSILVHSAAGGVGSMLVQMSKLLELSPVVGVVGRTAKVDAAKSLGCDVVIDKSTSSNSSSSSSQGDLLWDVANQAAPKGYAVVADANGVSTLKASFDHLAPTGRLIVFGFHSNLPMGQDMLHPMAWIQMILKKSKMPKFDAMDFVSSNKSLLGFNLSFFVDEIDMLSQLYDQVGSWLEQGKLQCPRIVEMDMTDIAAAHDLIQSGKSIGKIVMQTHVKLD